MCLAGLREPTKNLLRAREIPIWSLITLGIVGAPEMKEAIGILEFLVSGTLNGPG